MKILILTVTIFNFVNSFPYNGSQEIQNQTNQHFSANPPLPNHTASQLSSILSREENSPTEDSNSYSEPTDGVTRISGSLLERNHTKTHQASLYNFLSFRDDALSNSSTNLTSPSFAYVEETVANSQADPPKNTASSSTQDASAIRITASRFVPDSQMTQRRMAFSRKNSISAPVYMTNYQYKSDFTAIPHFQTNSKTTQRLEPFFPSTSKSKPFFASYPVIYNQNAKEKLTASADEGTIAKSNANSLFGTGTITHEDEAERPESIFFFDTIALVAEGNTAKIDATAIPEEEYITLFDVPGLESNIIIIDTAYQERYGKTVSNEPNLPKKDNSFVVDAINLKNDGGSTVNAQTPSIFSAKTSNDFESTPVLNTYDKDDSKSIMFAIDNDEAIFSVNSINTTNYFLNARMHNDKNSVVNSSTESKTMIDGAKSKMHVGDLITIKTNGFTSTKHYVNPNHLEPITKITWPSKEDSITKGRHTVQMEDIILSNNNIIPEAIGSKTENSIINYLSNTHANVHLQTDWDNFKFVSTDGIENVTPVVEEIANMNQDDEDVEVLFIQPDTSIVEDSRKFYSLNPDSDYTQVAGNKITLPSDNPVFNLLFKYKMKPFTMNSKSITNNRVDPGNPTIITSNDADTKMDFERTKISMFKTDNFQNNITSMASIPHPATAGSVYFGEDSVPDMTSASKVSVPSSDQYTYPRHKVISFSTNDNNADGVAGPNPETDFPMNQIYILPSLTELPKIMSNALNKEAQIYLLREDDYLTDSWRKISDPGAKNTHLTNDAIINNKALADPLNIPQKAAFLTADFISPSNAHNSIATGGKGNTNITNISELKINKATTTEGRPTLAITSLPAKMVGILIPNKKFRSLIAKEMANEEESIPYSEVESAVEEDGIVQMKENIKSAHNFKYFDSEDNILERNGVVDTVNSLSQFSTIPTSKLINERDLVTPGKENFNVVYDVTNPTNDKIHFKPMATVNSLGESVGVTQNVETADGTAFSPPGNSIPQTVRIDYSPVPNMYYNVVTKENPRVAWNTIKNKLPFSTMDNVDLIGHRGDYQMPTAISSSNANRLANIGKIAGTEITNFPLDIVNGAGNIFYEDENTEVVTDLASITGASPIKTDIVTTNEVNALYNKPNKLGHGLTISRKDPNVPRDGSTLSIADSNAFKNSESPFKHPQAINPVKKTSLADIIIPKTYFHNKATPTALKVAVTTASQGDVETMFYIPRYESENSFQEDITLNYEADIQKEESTMAEEEDILEENVRDYIYVIPIARDNIPKGNNVAAKHYSTNSDAYDSTRFRGITKARADQPEFEDFASSYAAESLKPLLRKFIPKVQRKMIIKNSDSGSDYAEFFGGDIFNPIMKENIPKRDIFTPERESTFMTPDLSIPMKDNINPGKVTKDVIKTNLMTSLNLANSTKMPPNATIISPRAPAFKSKEINENSDTTMPSIDGLLPIKLKSLFIPKKKIPRTEFPLSEKDDFLSDTAVTTLEASEPLSEHYTIIDQNWESINRQSANQPFSNVASFPLSNPTTFSEKPISVATERHTIGNGGINDKTDTMALSPNIVLQSIIHKKRGINKSSDYDVSQTAGSLSAKKTATSGTEASVFLGKEKATLDKEPSVSEASTPVNSRDLNAMKVNPSIFRPEAAFTEQKSPGNSKETFYPDSTISPTKLTEVRDRDSFSFDNSNLKQSAINSYNKLYHIPLKSTLYPTDFIKNSNSELDLALVIGESNMKMTGDSIIPNDIIVLSDNEIISPDNMIFIEDIRNIISGKSYVDSIAKDHVTQSQVIPFSNDFSSDSDMIFLAGENNPNNMDLTTISLDDSTTDYVSKENVFYTGEEETSPTREKTTSDQGEIYRAFGSPVPFSTAHAIENILKENPGRLKSKQKYQVLISRERNPDSDNNDSFLQDDITKFYSKSPNIMTTHSLTNENGIFSPTFSDDLTLEMGSPSGRDIITIPSESKWIELIHAPDPESMVTMRKNRILPGDTPILTMSSTPIQNREQIYGKGISVATYNFLREAEDTMSPKSKHNKDKTFKSENYNSQDIIVPSIAYVSLDSKFPPVYENFETNNFKDSVSLPMKSTYTMADIIALSPENSYEGSDYTPPHENDRSRELPLVLPTESIILIPKVLTKNSVLMRENPLNDLPRSISVLSEAGTKYLGLINETDISKNQGIKMQKDFHSHSLNSIINSRNSATFIRNSTIDDDDSPTVERETVDTSKIKTEVHPQGTITKILPSKQINSFLSGTREMTKPSVAEDTIADFNINHITNAPILIPALKTALLSTSEPSILSTRYNGEEENYISEAGNFVLRDSHTLKHNSSIDKFNISAGFQTPLILKRILLTDSTMSPENTLKPKDNNFASLNEDTGTEGLLYNAPSELYGLTWNSIPSPSDVTFISSSKYSELDPLVKMKKDTNTKTNNLFEERNNPTHEVISPGTKNMLSTIFNKRFVGKDITTEYEVVPISKNILDITTEGKNIPNNENLINTVLDDRALEYANERIFEPQEENYNPIIKKTALTHDPKIVESLPSYSSADASEHLSQEAPIGIKTKEILQNLILREEPTSPGLGAVIPKISTNNFSSKALRSVTHPLTHKTENVHKFIDKTTLESNKLGEDDTIIILPKDKRMEDTLVPNPEITPTKVERRMFSDETIRPIMINSPIKNKNQFYRKLISSPIYNTDIQDKAENTLSFRVNNVKKTNMVEMPHLQDSIIPLTEFSVTPDDELSFINEDTEVVNNGASISFSPINSIHTMEDTIILSPEGNYEGSDSMLAKEDNTRYKGSLDLQIHEKPMSIPNASRSVIYSLTDPNWTFSSEFYEAVLENDPSIADNTIIILPKGKKMKSPLVPDPELVSTITESRMFTADPTDSAVITIPIEYIYQLNMKGISTAFYNNVAPDVAKATISNRFGANKHETNLTDTSYSKDIVPLAVYSVIPDGDLPFISKDTNEANNRASIFSFSNNKAISTMEESSVLSNEGSYVRAKSMLPGEDNVQSKEFPSLLTSVIFIPNSLTENSEASSLVRDNTFSDFSIAMPEVLERITEYANANNGNNIPEERISTQSDIHFYPLAWNVSPMESTFLDASTDGEVDSFFSLNDLGNYKTKTDKTYSKSQKAMTKAYYPIEEFQNNVYKTRKVVNPSDQEDPAAKFKLNHIKNRKVLIPAMEKTFLPASKSNPLSNSDNMDEEFYVSEVGNLFLEETSTLNDKVASTGGSIAKTPIGSYALKQMSAIPPSDFTASMGTPKYSEFVPVFTGGKDPLQKIEDNIPSKETVISSDHVIILPVTISSKKDTASTFKGNVFEYKDFIERELATEDEIIDFTKDISKKVDDISSVGKITPAYVDHIIITPEDNNSEHVLDNYVSELEDKAKNSFIKMSTPSYAPNSSGTHILYTKITASDSLSKTKPSEFKAKGNNQVIMPRQENKNVDITFTKSDANVNNKVHRSTTHFQTDTNKNFPSRFFEKTSVGKGTTNGDGDTIILSENSDLGNRITKYSIIQGLKPIANNKTFTTDAPNHTVKNTYNSLKKDMFPTIYKIYTPRESDTTTSSISDLAEDETSLVVASDSRVSNLPLAQLSSDDIFNIEENSQGAINTALTSFSPLKKVSAIMPAVPAASIKDKINIDHSSLPLSKNARSLRFIPMGLPETPILTANVPNKEITALRLKKGENLYSPTMLISTAPESAFSDSGYFNDGVVSTRQNIRSQMIPKALYLIYTVSQDGLTSSSDNLTDTEPNTSVTTGIRDKFFYTDASGDQNAEPSKTISKFYTFFPNEHIEPNFYYTKEIAKASRMKNTTTEFEANHFTDKNKLRNDIAFQMETNPLPDTDLNLYPVSKNLTAGDKSVNKDFNSVSKPMYSSSSIRRNSHPTTSVPQESNTLAGDLNLFTEVIIIPTSEISSSYPEIIFPMRENSHLEFNMPNLRTPNSEFQALESVNIIREPIVIEKNLPRFQEISTVQQKNKKVEENTLFRTHIPQLQTKKVTSKAIPEESTNDRADVRVITDSAVNAIFLGNKEIVTPQDSTSVDYNFLSHTPNIQITGRKEDKNMNVDMDNSQNVIAPFISFFVSEDGNYFMIEDTEQETSSVTTMTNLLN